MELSMVVTIKDEHAPGLSRIVAYVDFMKRNDGDIKRLFDLPQVKEAGFKLEPYISNKGW